MSFPYHLVIYFDHTYNHAIEMKTDPIIYRALLRPLQNSGGSLPTVKILTIKN